MFRYLALLLSLSFFVPATFAATPPRQVVLIVMENHEYSSIIGSASAPYINSLASTYSLATNYYANHHPSLPNYLDLVAGSRMGIKDDGEEHILTGNFLGKQLYKAGWVQRVYAESMPSSEMTEHPCDFPTSGSYKKKHNPYAYWDWTQGVSGKASHCWIVNPFSEFDPSNLKAFTFIIPNICHDMHDCSISTGDDWLKAHVPGILSHMSGGDVVIITFDEGTTNDFGGGHVVTIFAGPGAKTHFTDSTFYTHYSLLKTIEKIFKVKCLRKACDATAMMNMLQ